jgi:hypothetical protein
MMLFDTKSRILLAKAALLIERGDEQFICIAIDECVGDSEENQGIADKLRDAIELAIEGHYTFENYLYWKYGIRHERTNQERKDFFDDCDTEVEEIIYFEKEKYSNFTREARLAWIDRILETNEVK